MIRFSLLTLVGIVTVVALACAALINASPWVSGATWSIVLVGLAAATVAAVLTRSRRRGFWTGFGIVGWLFTLAIAGPLLENLPATLLSRRLLERAATAMPQARQTTPQRPLPWAPRELAYRPATGTYIPSTPAYAPPTPANASPAFPNPAVATQIITTYTPTAVIRALNTEFVEAFIAIGQALVVLILALAGGLLGQFLVARNERTAELPSAAR